MQAPASAVRLRGEFAAHGYDVALIARDQPRLDDAAAECAPWAWRALADRADVADFAALDPRGAQSSRSSGRSTSG